MISDSVWRLRSGRMACSHRGSERLFHRDVRGLTFPGGRRRRRGSSAASFRFPPESARAKEEDTGSQEEQGGTGDAEPQKEQGQRNAAYDLQRKQ